MPFRWNEWNLDHATRHGVSPGDAEAAVLAAKPPYPEQRGDGKWAVMGQAPSGAYVQVVYVVDPDDTLYIVHARWLNDHEKRRYRRRKK